jgi:hypothetical protein
LKSIIDISDIDIPNIDIPSIEIQHTLFTNSILKNITSLSVSKSESKSESLIDISSIKIQLDVSNNIRAVSLLYSDPKTIADDVVTKAKSFFANINEQINSKTNISMNIELLTNVMKDISNNDYTELEVESAENVKHLFTEVNKALIDLPENVIPDIPNNEAIISTFYNMIDCDVVSEIKDRVESVIKDVGAKSEPKGEESGGDKDEDGEDDDKDEDCEDEGDDEDEDEGVCDESDEDEGEHDDENEDEGVCDESDEESKHDESSHLEHVHKALIDISNNPCHIFNIKRQFLALDVEKQL